MYKQGTACRFVDVEHIKINKYTNIDYIDVDLELDCQSNTSGLCLTWKAPVITLKYDESQQI